MIHPFVAGFYDGDVFTSFWSDDCITRIIEMLADRTDRLIIYAHNGGRFDFFYFLTHISKNLRIVNGRIIQAWLGKHELRDSFAIMPFALDKYQKTEIDYNKFTKKNREKNREEILKYLRDDCTSLHELCVAFLAEFGPNLTIGGASMKQLKHFHKFDNGNKEYDERLRKRFYFGGRNQCFQTGNIRGPIRIYDVNSMYPHVMRDYLHPVSTGLYRSNKIDEKTSFI
ncbi:MAG TPA: DNA polymerase, partial [Steroidobacteraceae bacterium]|nr:DNA polymerase [Steroidobacteraceae bacterium]